MKSRVIAIRRFLINQVSYRNRHAIEFDMLDDSVLVSFTDYHNPHHQYADLFLSYEKNIHRFMIDFDITSPKDLDAIGIDQLWKLFWQGKGKIYCALQYSVIYFPVYYKYIDQKLLVIDQYNVKHEVNNTLTSIDDFMSYTCLLFKKVRVCRKKVPVCRKALCNLLSD